MSQSIKKLVAVMNKKLDTGVALNAIGHMSLGFGGKMGEQQLSLVDYVDAEQNVYPSISKEPFIVLRANSNKINMLRKAALANNIEFSVFTDTMTGGTWQEQLDRTKQSKSDDIMYYGIILYGDFELVHDLTRKFSLWR